MKWREGKGILSRETRSDFTRSGRRRTTGFSGISAAKFRHGGEIPSHLEAAAGGCRRDDGGIYEHPDCPFESVSRQLSTSDFHSSSSLSLSNKSFRSYYNWTDNNGGERAEWSWHEWKHSHSNFAHLLEENSEGR